MANRIQLQTALQEPYDRILFGKKVLSPVFGSFFELFNSAVPAPVQPNKSEQKVIQSVSIYGAIHLEDGTEITCYEINLQPSVRIEHSKVAIQRYVRKLLTAGQIALVNFIAPQNKKVWRLTLIAKDSELTEQGITEKTTHTKRYTYLLGPSETCKTAAERFESLSTEKQITFQALVNAFSVEKLSKAFFDEYTLHYQKFCDYLQESNFRKSVFNISISPNASKEEKDKACKPIRDFVKKLLGRIVFLYFVQKKGWLGASDTDYKDGMPDFIKQLFIQSGSNDAFYSTCLTFLFFETLNKKRNNDDFKMPNGKTVKVPFLNGGLFDKEDYDEAVLTLPAKLFHNPDFEDTPLTEKNKTYARGFLDFLDAFNFTVHEDSPDDHTVAVDPEMLGHIFENLLEDNKDKGAFYTPKEIVHYMCQESLTEYLKNSPPTEGCQTSSDGVVKRATQNYFSLPYNPKLKEHAKALRKAGNLAEVLFWNRVKNKQFKSFDFDRQKIIGNYIVDFYCVNCNVVIEIDGSSHNDKVEYDAERDAYLQRLGLTTIHIRAEEVLKNLDAVMEMLFNHPALQVPLQTRGMDHPALSGTPPMEGNEPPLAPPTERNFGQGIECLIKHKDASLLSEHQLRYIDEKLNAVKICDPAIGSGAFPMGLLQEIYAIKEVIAYELQQPWKPAEVKENIIQNSIYGVDIEKGAVDIARLRFWLSLVVDKEKPKPLPNLDYKIVVGNSLVSKFEDEVIEIDWEIKEGTQGHLFGNENVLRRQALLKKITEKQRDYFHATEKQQLADEIRNLKIDILINQLELMIKTKGLENKPTQSGRKVSALMELWLQTQGWKNAIAKLQKLKQNKEEPFKHFDWKLDFPEVLNPYLVNDDGGFDIVIGNPPYIQLQKEGGQLAKLYEKQNFQTFARKGDIYALFYEKGMQLLKHKGILAYITSNKWMRAGYGEKLRQFFTQHQPLLLIDLGPGVFENATVDTNILLIQKQKPSDNFQLKALTLHKEDRESIAGAVEQKATILQKLTADAWFIGSNAEQQLKEKIERLGKPLKDWDVNIYRGVLTGLNEAFIITTEKRNEILANCKDEEERKRTEAIIKPILRGRDIKRYYYEWAGLWVIGTFPALRLNIDDYPALKKYFLDNFDKRQLEQSGKKYPELGFNARKKTGNKWFETQDQIAYYPEFEKEKVVYPNMSYRLMGIWDDKKFLTNQKCFIITGNNTKYITALLNSEIEFWYFKKIGATLGREGYEMSKIFMENLPLPPITFSNEPIVKQIENLVDKILSTKKENPQADTSAWEREIDRLVYQLYDLTAEEIKIIEGEK